MGWRRWNLAAGRLGATAKFIAPAERASGMDLDRFFRVWLYQPEKPTTW